MKLNQVFSGLLLTAVVASGCKSTNSTTAAATTTEAAVPGVKKEVLFTIDGKPYYTDEFARIYEKNLDLVKDDSQKDLNNYLDLFVGYKLKVAKAEKLGLQENKKFQGEFKSYRSQYAKKYLTDSEVTDELLKEAYERSKKEINASHILFLADENATPADTLKAYNKAVEARKRVLAGEDFAVVAKQVSEDPSAKDNGGNLGYFSVFRMVYPFESGAYNTPKGEVSQPVRSRFGYHIIKVNDVRENRGEIVVAHIMVMKPKADDTAEAAKAKQKIEDIYKKLQQGEDFAELAKQFSEDKTSAVNGGKLNSFNSGELTSGAFEDHSFALKTPGEISQPFESQFGWHIIKLLEKKPAKTYEQVKPEFENRIKRDDRSRIIAESVTSKLKKKYTTEKDKNVYKAVTAAVTDSIYKMTWKMPADLKAYDKTLVTINKDRKLSGSDFLKFIYTQQNLGLTAKPVTHAVDVLYDKYIDEQLYAYYNDNLEGEFPEFAATMQEYHDGLLLYDLMEKEIWEKAKTDTVALSNYYNAHVDAYQWKQRAQVEVYSAPGEASVKQAREMLLKGKDAEAIKAKLNTKDKVSIIEKAGTFETGSDAMPKLTEWKPGVSQVVKEGTYYYVVKTVKVLPAGAKTLDEAKGRVINDYQQYLEDNWVDSLKKEFTVKVNQDVFENVKKEIKK